MTGWMWYLIALGVAVLALALAYGTRKTAEHRRDPEGYRRTEEAAAKLDKDRPPTP